MNAPTIDIKDYLAADPTLGLTYADNLHIGKEPTIPNTCVTLYDTGGQPLLDLCKSVYDYKGVEVRIRHSTYDAGWNMAQAILNVINGFSNAEINGTYYAAIEAAGGPQHLDYDEKNRVRFIINLDIQRRN